jgi:hypothetical protein
VATELHFLACSHEGGLVKRLRTSSSLLIDRVSQLGCVLPPAAFGQRHRREMTCFPAGQEV